MILFAIVIYSAFLFVLYKVTPKRGDLSIFGFRKLFFLIAAAELPFVITVGVNPDILHPRVLANMGDLQAVFIQFLALKALFLTAFTITAFHFGGASRSHAATLPVGLTTERLAPLDLQLSMAMLLLTAATYALLLQEVGGLNELILSWSTKSEILVGTAAYRTANLVFGMLTVGFYISYIGHKRGASVGNLIVLFFLILVVLAVLVSVGERKNPVLIIIFSIVMWHFRVNRINVMRPSYLVLFFVFLVFAAVFPELRRPGGTELFFSQPMAVLTASASNWGQLFARVSDIETSLFIYSYFDDPKKFWYGASFADLLTGVVPSSLMPDKPPIDEGVYIYALSFNYYVTPPVPFRDLIPVGWPVSRVTGPYVHFGTIGVLIGALATGYVVRRIAGRALSTLSPGSTFVFVWVMFTGFGLTNAFIFNLAVIVALLVPVELYYRTRVRSWAGRAAPFASLPAE